VDGTGENDEREAEKGANSRLAEKPPLSISFAHQTPQPDTW
jgi:hypothetical protein